MHLPGVVGALRGGARDYDVHRRHCLGEELVNDDAQPEDLRGMRSA